ncbi:MAG: MATE family efflux transporter [Muribaculaceae bacterium]|nr:MATE family efflux transporter [Muribaculaceae bacterium]
MNINREIFRIAIPAIVSNITVPLLGLADTTISGHLGSEIYLASISVGTMMINVMLWCFGFLRAGTSGMTAQAYGAKDVRRQHELFSSSLALGLLLGLLLMLLQIPMAWLLLKIISPDTAVTTLAGEYFHIMIWSMPAVLGTMAVSGWFLGMQSSTYPMIIAIFTNVVNIVLSVVLVFACHYGFKGTAIGTCLANWLGFILALLMVKYFNKGKLPLSSLREVFTLRGKGRFFRVNSDIFLRSMCIMSVSLGMTAFGAKSGSLTLAVNAVMMQFFMFFSYFMDGFAFSAEALTGRCVGSRDHGMLRRVEHALSLWAVAMAVLFTSLYALFWPQICHFITTEADVLAGIDEYHIWLIMMPCITVAAFIYDGMYIGLTATRLMLIATACGTAIFFLFNMVVQTEYGPIEANNMLWAAFLSYLLIRSIALGSLYRNAVHKIFGQNTAIS